MGVWAAWGAAWALGAMGAEGRSLGVMYALEADWAAMTEVAGRPARTVVVGGLRLQEVELGEHRVTAVRMGSGGARTAVSAAVLLSRGPFDLVVTIGPAGVLTEKWPVGTMVRVGRAVFYQTGKVGEGGAEGSKEWRAEGDGEGGAWAGEGRGSGGAGAGAGGGPGGSEEPGETGRGLLAGWPGAEVASGELFIESDSFRTELAEETGCDLVEMNLVGAATALEVFGAAAAHFRIVSDRADARAGADFARFVEGYDGRLGRAVAEALRDLPKDPGSPESYDALRGLLGK